MPRSQQSPPSVALRHTWAWLIGLTLLTTSSAPARSAEDEGGDYAQGYSEPDGNQASGAPDPRRLKQAPDPVKDALGADAPGTDDDLLRKADKANTSSASKADRTALESRFPKIEAPKASKAIQDAARQQDWRQQAQNLPPAGPLVSVNKSGVKPQVLSLPEGKGSVRGMGLTFRTNLQTGSASLSLPVSLPPARRGVGPSLSFDYSSGGSQGVAGLGWGFDVGFIARQADKGLPRYLDDIDHFVYNGGRELVRVSPTTGEVIPAEYGGAGARYYRAKVEGLLMRFFRMGSSPQSTYWVAQDKDGTLYYFGGDDSGLDLDALVCDATCTRIFRWNLVLVRDVHGNEVRYVYTKDQGASYLAEVLYNNHPEVTGQYQHRVEVVYESRPDVLTGYQTGFGITTADRVSEVRVFTDYGATAPRLDGQPSDSNGRLLVRAYRLTYKEDRLHSLLEEVQLLGKDNDPDTGLPPVRFEYQEVTGGTDFVPGLGYVNGEVRSLAGSPGGSIGDGRRDLLDVDGDGLADVFETDPTAPGALMKYYLNTGDALPNAPIAFGSAPSLQLSNTNVQLLDLDGDGRVELIHMPHIGSYSIYRLECAPVAANQTGDRRQCSWSLFGSIPANPSIDLTTDAAEIRLVDLNGDHLIDVVKTTGTQMQHWLNLSAYPGGEGKFGQVDVTTGTLSDQPIRTCVLHKGLPIQFSDSRVKLADMNGDGLQDIVLVDFGSLVYWPNQGYGVWGLGGACPAGTFGSDREVTIGNAPYYSSQDPTLVRFGDVNGDGLADMMQIRFNAVDVWLNAITEMRDRAILQQTPVFSGITDRVRLADVNGSGSRDILWGDGGNYRYVDLTGGIKPRIITRVHNGLGGVTEIDYEASTAQYLQDRAEGREWKTVCPFPTQVVREVRTRDQMDLAGSGWPEGVYTTRYRYHDCYWDGFEHEYRGFAEVDEERLGDTNSPTSHATHYFYQGKPGEASPSDPTLTVEALKGTEHRMDTWTYATPDGAPDPVQGASTPRVYLSTVVTAYAVRTVLEPHTDDLPPGKDPVRDARPVRFAYSAETHTFGYNTHSFVSGSQPVTLPKVRAEGAGGTDATTYEADVILPAAASVTTHLKSIVDDVDDFGNTRQATAHGCVSGCSLGEVDQPITQHATFAMNTSKWIHRPCESWATAGPSGTIAYNHKLLFYDGADSQASSWGSQPGMAACTVGNQGLNRKGEYRVYYGNEPVKTIEEHLTDFTAFGLPRHTRALKKLESWFYHEEPTGYQALVTREVIRVGLTADEAAGIGAGSYGETPVRYLTTRVSYDPGLGAVREYRDENDQKSEVIYDALGRITELWTAHEPRAGCIEATQPAARISYHLADQSGRPYSFVNTKISEDRCDPAKVQEAYAYMDGMGRTRLTVTEGDQPATEPGHTEWIGSGFQMYDAKGAVSQALTPGFLAWSPGDVPHPMTATNCGADPVDDTSVCMTATRHDAFGRATIVTLPDGVTSETRYLGPFVTEAHDGNDTDPTSCFYSTPTTTVKDGHGRVKRLIEQNRTPPFDGAWPTDCTDYSVVTLIPRDFHWDALGNLVSVSEYLAGEVIEKHQVFDSLGRRREIQDPDAGTWRFVFDDAGNLVESTDGKWNAGTGDGNRLTYSYDTANRIVREVCAECAGFTPATDVVLVTYRYDAPARLVGGRGYMPMDIEAGTVPQDWVLGRLVQATDETGSHHYSYDRPGRQVTEVQQVSAALPGGGNAYVARVRYDDLGRVIRLEYPGVDGVPSLVVDHEYNNRGLVLMLFGPDALTPGGTTEYLLGAKYNAWGLRTEYRYGDASAIRFERTYDRHGRLHRSLVRQTVATEPGTPAYSLQDYEYTYDRASNVMGIRDLRPPDDVDTYTEGANRAHHRTMLYDARYRLVRTRYSDSETGDLRRDMRYAYDEVGNIRRIDTTDENDDDNRGQDFYERWLGSVSYADPAHPHALTEADGMDGRQVVATYDGNGNMTTLSIANPGGVPARSTHFTYVWDHYNRLVRAEKTEAGMLVAELENTYDHGDQRVAKREVGSGGEVKETLYVTEGFEIRNTADERYVFDGRQRVARAGAAQPYESPGVQQSRLFLVADHLGSTSSVIDDTPGIGQARVARTTSYLPFGAVEAESPPPSEAYLDEMHLFAGKELERGAGAYSIGSRWMNPHLGRWLSPDLTYLALDDKTAFSTEASNVYEYVVANPYKLLDPDGSKALSAMEKRQAIERTLRRPSDASPTERIKVVLDMARKNVAISIHPKDRIQCSNFGSLVIGYMTGKYPPDRWVIFREKLPSTIWKETRIFFDAFSHNVLLTTPPHLRPSDKSLVWGYRDYKSSERLRDRHGTLPRFHREGDMQLGKMWRMPIGYQLSASGPGEYIAEAARRHPTAMFGVSLSARHYGTVVSDPEHAGRFTYFDQYRVVGNLTAAGLTKQLAAISRSVDAFREPFIGIGVIVPRSGAHEAQNAQ